MVGLTADTKRSSWKCRFCISRDQRKALSNATDNKTENVVCQIESDGDVSDDRNNDDDDEESGNQESDDDCNVDDSNDDGSFEEDDGGSTDGGDDNDADGMSDSMNEDDDEDGDWVEDQRSKRARKTVAPSSSSPNGLFLSISSSEDNVYFSHCPLCHQKCGEGDLEEIQVSSGNCLLTV